MKLSRSSVLSSLLLASAIALPSLAQASYTGDTVTITGSSFALVPDTVSTTGVVGSGVEFSQVGDDFFGQHWVLDVDVASYGFKLSFNETTSGYDGNLYADPDEIYGVDISFASSPVYAHALTSYTTSSTFSSMSNLIGITKTGESSLHLSFSGIYSSDVYVISVVPEPQTYAMLLAGLALAGVAARRQRKS